MDKIKEIPYRWFVLVGVIIAAVVVFLFWPQEESTPSWEELPQETQVVEVSQASTEEEIVVDIKGEVEIPGVYELALGARVQEVVQMAGGFTENAEERALNLAECLTDQQMIYVPGKEEAQNNWLSAENTAAGESDNSVVNLNTADLTELQTLSGIGVAKAQAIIDYRKEHGNFKKIEDLKEVSGIGEKTFERLKDSIKV